MSAPESVPRFFRDGVVYRKVLHHEANDCILLGWVPTPVLDGTIHGQYCIMMMWLCECPMRVPLREAA